MAQASSGSSSAAGSGSLGVAPSALRAAARQARQIAGELSGLAAKVTAACSGAVAAHRGWRFGAALAALVSPWQGQLARVGEAIAGDGDRLAGTADTYGTTEADNTGLSRSADRLLP